jgi:2-C-methyl-D-erythritol 4-phosphate cytidylyltransferase/2-C-methyl-D-erythritol 2,4-cyclodiphosphate synthase
VQFAVDRIIQRGGRLVHVDITLVCETPRLGPHRSAILAVISRLCGLPTTKIGLKATTSEKMGFTGRGEGLAAQAIATVLLPD